MNNEQGEYIGDMADILGGIMPPMQSKISATPKVRTLKQKAKIKKKAKAAKLARRKNR